MRSHACSMSSSTIPCCTFTLSSLLWTLFERMRSNPCWNDFWSCNNVWYSEIKLSSDCVEHCFHFCVGSMLNSASIAYSTFSISALLSLTIFICCTNSGHNKSTSKYLPPSSISMSAKLICL